MSHKAITHHISQTTFRIVMNHTPLVHYVHRHCLYSSHIMSDHHRHSPGACKHELNMNVGLCHFASTSSATIYQHCHTPKCPHPMPQSSIYGCPHMPRDWSAKQVIPFKWGRPAAQGLCTWWRTCLDGSYKCWIPSNAKVSNICSGEASASLAIIGWILSKTDHD